MALQRRVLMAHRDGARVLAATPPVGPHRLRLNEQVLRALVSAGFSPEKTADASFVMNSHVVGFVLDETLGSPRDTGSAKRMREEVRRWFKSLPKERYPTLVSLADELIDAPADRRFALGIRALLDGLELRLSRKGSRWAAPIKPEEHRAIFGVAGTSTGSVNLPKASRRRITWSISIVLTSRYAITASLPRAAWHTCFELTKGGNDRENVGERS